jgi:hypothetical protein
MDEPVDVVIVVKSDFATADTAAVDTQNPDGKAVAKPGAAPLTGSSPSDVKK